MAKETGTKPIQLQRRRVWRACESCRRKKIKCDGCEPTCSQCSASGSTCTWLQTKDRAALSRHYVQELEARLLHMESLFSQIAPVLEQLGPAASNLVPQAAAAAASASNGATQAAEPQTPLSATSPSSVNFPQRAATPMKIEDDADSLDQVALDEYGHMRWIGGSSTMSLIQSFRALTVSPMHRISPMEEDPQAPGPSVNKIYFPAAVFFGKVKALPGPEEVEYPDRDLADKLVEAYFSKFHYLLPVIDKPSFMRKYTSIMDNKQDPAIARTEAPFLSLLFALFANAAPLVQDSRLTVSERTDDGGMGMVYYERAMILQYISHPNIQISHVQCSILMSSFLCSVNCLPQAWILIGQAVRTAQDLGLHRSPRRLLISNIEKETRRKVWWGVYTLDRMLALALGRPIGVNDSDCDVEQPAEVDDVYLPEYFTGASMVHRQPSLMGGIIALNKLYEIGGRVLRQVYSLEIYKEQLEPEKKAELQRTVEALDNELTAWCENLPPVFKSQSETDEQVSMGAVLCSHYYSILTTLHRNLLPVSQDQAQPVTAKSTVKAVSSARSCIRLAPSIKHVVPPSHHLAFFIQHLFSSAVILLLYSMHSPDPRASGAALEEAKSTLSALESWEGQWPGAKKCKELLAELAETAIRAVAKGTAAALQSPTSPTVISPTAAPSDLHRRRSVTISTIPQAMQPPGRNAKGRSSRRNPSRDPVGPTSRRLAAVSPYRVDSARRARSASRKRGPDDPDAVDRTGSFYQSFRSPSSGPGGSNHSSPASATLPSPAMSHVENLASEASPSMAHASVSPSYTYTPPVSAAPLQSSPTRFEQNNEFHVTSPLSQSSSAALLGQSNDQQNTGFYPLNPADSSLYSSYGFNTGMDSSFGSFDGSAMGLSIAGPSSSFAATGLPFPGLDFIKNYNTGGYSANEQDALWQSYDPGAFGFDPDMPFSLGDAALDSMHTDTNNSHS